MSMPVPTYTSVSRVMERLRAVLAPALDRPFWLRAEIGSAGERDGSFYGELVDAEAGQGGVVAKIRCTIWSNDLRRIRARFARDGLELQLQRGTVVGLQCVVQFHASHGLSIRVIDMDPAFVLGELELRRRRIMMKLEQDGLLGRNSERAVPLLPNRVVLITSAAGAAFHDFMQTLTSRRVGIRVLLADSLMQGPDTEKSILAALSAAERLQADLVVLIRGGGSKIDLGWLDSEAIACRIAELRLPVWTGIGHETDSSVLDAVAAQAFRTPTALAEALVARFERVAVRLAEAEARMRSVFAAASLAQRERLERDDAGLRQCSQKLLMLRGAQLSSSASQVHRRAIQRMAAARVTWQARAHRMEQASRLRIAVAWRALDQLHTKVPACGAHGIERRVNALRDVTSRFERLHLAERFVGERARIRHQHAVLHRGGTQQLLTTRAMLNVGSNELSGRTSARLASARLMLAPRIQSLRGVLDVRMQAAAARLGGTHGQLIGVCHRALQRHMMECERASTRLSLPRICARWERERALLEDRRRILRASDPRRALERGYSLTYTTAGALVRSIHDVVPGQSITTHVADGHVEATVHEIGKETRDERDDKQHV